jgi:ribosomal-protein-alanine N-acetyltransferase
MQRSVAKNACARTDGIPVRMDLSDVGDVAALEREVFSDPWSADSFLAEVERRPEIGYPVVVRSGGHLVAYAVAWFIVDELHIGNIAVRPECQGRGLASMLLEHLLEEGRRRDMVFATLEVRPSNARALALYGKFGFRQIARRRNYYRDNREDALVLAAALHPSAEARLG